MPTDRVLSQEEIDDGLGDGREPNPDRDLKRALPYDFRRPDRIAKDQLRSIHLLHETFARSLASSLSAYLRAYVIVNLVSVEQLSFIEFSQCLPSPTCLVTIGMKPFEGNAVLEINPVLVFPILEMLLGGNAKTAMKLTREITEIEESILDGLYRVIMHDLQTAWHSVVNLEFVIESHETEPQLLQILSPNEAVVAVSLEIRVGDNAGMMNIGIPSIMVKMLRHKFDQQWSMRRSQSSEEQQARVLRLLKPATVVLDGRIDGPTLQIEDLMELAVGDVLALDFPIEKPVNMTVNRRMKYRGHVVTTGGKRAFQIEQFYHPLD